MEIRDFERFLGIGNRWKSMISDDFGGSEIIGNPRFRTILRDRKSMETHDFGRFGGIGNLWKSMISDDFGGSEFGGNP